jgi:cell fate regulator YaaT (PSP1 superfamily)
MGCSSCSTSTGDTSPGCKNNGTCGTSGCNKLNVYNWLADMELPQGEKSYNIVEVRFKGSRKEFFRNSEYLELKTGDMVAVEGNPGHDIGTVSIAGELVRFQLKKKGVTEDSDEIKALYRLARPADVEKFNAVKALEVETMYRARSIALSLNLRMKLSDVEYQGDGKKATFFYTAEERVDFRELIKKLAEEFKVRIEMRQIGMRQEASRLGGIGSCGRELCCSTWLTDFKVVSTSAARYQNLSLNPLKLAGQCGKLKCCLNYELDSYIDAIADIPDSNSRLETKKGYALHRKTDIFQKNDVVRLCRDRCTR